MQQVTNHEKRLRGSLFRDEDSFSRTTDKLQVDAVVSWYPQFLLESLSLLFDDYMLSMELIELQKNNVLFQEEVEEENETFTPEVPATKLQDLSMQWSVSCEG